MRDASVTTGPFEGIWLIELTMRGDDERPGSSFREVWKAELMRRSGVPEFQPVQWNIAVSSEGTLRGVHAEPWHKAVHVVEGEVFAAVADLRPASPTAGQVWTRILDPSVTVFLQRGLGNAYQVISSRAVYAYLVDGRWDPAASYPAVRWDDPDLAIDWPITDERLALSAKDRTNPSLAEHWRERDLLWSPRPRRSCSSVQRPVSRNPNADEANATASATSS